MRATLVGVAFLLGFASSAQAGGGPPKGKPPAPVPSPAPPSPAKPEAGAKPEGRTFSGHTGDLKFVVGFDEGMEQAWAAGRPAMLFFTSAKDKWCPIFGRRTWTNKDVLEKVKAYLPVLVDADTERAKDRMKHYTILVLPAVVWVDGEGDQIFAAQGDSPLDLFDTAADIAKDRAPAVKPPEELVFAERVRADLKKANAAHDVRRMLDAATALAAMKRPKAASEEGNALLADLEAKGRVRLDAAKQALAEGKTAAATAELEKLAAEYRGRPLGREAAEALPKEKDADAGDK